MESRAHFGSIFVAVVIVVSFCAAGATARYCDDGTKTCRSQPRCAFTFTRCYYTWHGCKTCGPWTNDPDRADRFRDSLCERFDHCVTCQSGIYWNIDDGEATFQETCRTCAADRYGPQCVYQCDGQCATCDGGKPSGSGECVTCPPRRFGLWCQETCSSKCETCQEGPRGDGRCLSCPSGHYGPTCDGVCSCPPYQDCKDDLDGDGTCTCRRALDNGKIESRSDSHQLKCSDQYWPFANGVAALSRTEDVIQCNSNLEWQFSYQHRRNQQLLLGHGRRKRDAVSGFTTESDDQSKGVLAAFRRHVDAALPWKRARGRTGSGYDVVKAEAEDNVLLEGRGAAAGGAPEKNENRLGHPPKRTKRAVEKRGPTDDFRNKHMVYAPQPEQIEGQVATILQNPTAWMEERGLASPSRPFNTFVLIAGEADYWNFLAQTDDWGIHNRGMVTGPFRIIDLVRTWDGQYYARGPFVTSYLQVYVDEEGRPSHFAGHGPPVQPAQFQGAYCIPYNVHYQR